MNVRPRRTIPFTANSWENQAPQYNRRDVPKPLFGGITYWRVPPGEVPVPIHCLLHWTWTGNELVLTGILNWFPKGSAFGDEPGDLMVVVHPRARRQGIGRKLLLHAEQTFKANLQDQCFTPEGWALVQSILKDR